MFWEPGPGTGREADGGDGGGGGVGETPRAAGDHHRHPAHRDRIFQDVEVLLQGDTGTPGMCELFGTVSFNIHTRRTSITINYNCE